MNDEGHLREAYALNSSEGLRRILTRVRELEALVEHEHEKRTDNAASWIKERNERDAAKRRAEKAEARVKELEARLAAHDICEVCKDVLVAARPRCEKHVSWEPGDGGEEG